MKKTGIFLKLAVRNLLRNKRRCTLTAIGITVSVATIVLGLHYGDSIIHALLDSASSNLFADVTVFSKSYESKDAKEQFLNILGPHKTADSIIEYPEVEKILNQLQGVETILTKVKLGGMIYSEDRSTECLIMGIEPSKERLISSDKIRIIEGKYLSSPDQIMLSNQIAQEINVKAGDEIAVLTSNLDGAFSGKKLKVIGIANYCGMEMFLSSVGYIHIEDARYLLGIGKNECSLMAIKLKDRKDANEVATSMNILFSKHNLDIKALPYNKAGKLFVRMGKMQKFMVTIITILFYIIAFVGLSSNALVSIFERIREIGVMRAIGANPNDIRLMFLIENIILIILAALFGCFIATGIVLILSNVGIPAHTETFRILYAGERLYLKIFIGDIIYPFVFVTLVTSIFTLGVVNKAARLKPIEALRYV
jgi:putative ABC transport system permease protein